MSRRQKITGAGADSPAIPSTWCDYCGKMAYFSRADARKVIKALHRGRMMAYDCKHTPEAFDTRWHIGHPTQPARSRSEMSQAPRLRP